MYRLRPTAYALAALALVAPLSAARGGTAAKPVPWAAPLASPWQNAGIACEAAGDSIRLEYVVGTEPDVWPSAAAHFPEPEDISGRSGLSFRLRAEAPRPLPVRFLSVLFRDAWGGQWQKDHLPVAPKPGEEALEKVDLLEGPGPLFGRLTLFQFFVWNRDFLEAGFAPGDRVVFTVSGLSLTGDRRETQARMLDGEPFARVLASDRRADVWSEAPDNKIIPEQQCPSGARVRRDIRLEAAGNEYVDFQIAVRAKDHPLRVSVEVDPPGRLKASDVLVRPVGLIVTKVASSGYFRAGPMPDPLLEPGPADVPAGETRSFWVRIYVPEGAEGGSHTGEVRVRSGATTLARAKLSLKVYGFSLPRDTSLPTAFQVNVDREWSRFLEYYPDAGYDILRRFWESFAAHRIAPMHPSLTGPPRPDTPAAMAEFDRYLDLAEELRLSHLDSFFWGPPVDTEEDRAWVRRIVDHYVARGMLDRTHVYMCQFDEAGPDRWPQIREYAAKLKAADPRIQRMLTVAPAGGLYGSIDVWCPLTYHYDKALARGRRQAGEKVWWYTAVAMTPGFLIDQPGAEHRALMWLTHAYEADGFLFWCVSYWPRNPWEEPQMGPGTAGNGDGFLYYPRRPGDPADRLYETIRLELIRDGIEDYEYLRLLDTRLAEEKTRGRYRAAARRALKTRELAARIAGDIRAFSRAPEDYALVRREIARSIEELAAQD